MVGHAFQRWVRPLHALRIASDFRIVGALELMSFLADVESVSSASGTAKSGWLAVVGSPRWSCGPKKNKNRKYGGDRRDENGKRQDIHAALAVMWRQLQIVLEPKAERNTV